MLTKWAEVGDIRLCDDRYASSKDFLRGNYISKHCSY